MRKTIFIGIFCIILSGMAVAQIPTSGNVFFGYSYFNTNPSGSGRVNTNGWEASFEGKVLPFIGLVADFDSHYGSQNSPLPVVPAGTCPTTGCVVLNGSFTEHNYLFGPRVGISVGKVRPFAEAMFGAAHVNTANAGSDTSFATAIGGGLDYRLIRLVAWRLQGDYVHTHLFGIAQDNVRISTGIVVRF